MMTPLLFWFFFFFFFFFLFFFFLFWFYHFSRGVGQENFRIKFNFSLGFKSGFSSVIHHLSYNKSFPWGKSKKVNLLIRRAGVPFLDVFFVTLLRPPHFPPPLILGGIRFSYSVQFLPVSRFLFHCPPNKKTSFFHVNSVLYEGALSCSILSLSFSPPAGFFLECCFFIVERNFQIFQFWFFPLWLAPPLTPQCVVLVRFLVWCLQHHH